MNCSMSAYVLQCRGLRIAIVEICCADQVYIESSRARKYDIRHID